MVSIPFQLDDAIERTNALLDGFSSPSQPSSSGVASRQSLIPNERTAVQTRQMVRWLVPETGIVEMYINPQRITYNYKKLITPQRTKGGYTLQYWGEDLTTLNIEGTTGTSGVEGINVLYDVYRAEQVAFDPVALALASQNQAQASQLQSKTAQIINTFADIIAASQDSGINTVSSPRPSLASFAFTVEMYWSGWVFRGFFNDFHVSESSDKLGMFDYTIGFTVTQRRGFRQNFLGWHRGATSGPSNSANYGTPHSYGSLANGFNSPNIGGINNPNLSGNGGVNNIGDIFNNIIKL